MDIISIKHKGLQTLIEHNDAAKVPANMRNRIKNVLAAIVSATDINGVIGPPGWNVHQLQGDRAGTWSVSVKGNWRVTFKPINNQVHDLHLEDYH
ncbi:MAG TPA: type II toxin-antitoxin system RelE/ParE family toxin [Ensifer sp.]|nr:type II toxin-antitoxin system RelE/ParE family toxin [Ensifer sp.]